MGISLPVRTLLSCVGLLVTGMALTLACSDGGQEMPAAEAEDAGDRAGEWDAGLVDGSPPAPDPPAPPVGNPPLWLKGVAVNQWVEIPNTKIDSVIPNPMPKGSRTGRLSYGGGTIKPKGSEFIVWNGGHADYGSNEVVAIRLSDDSPEWRTVSPHTNYDDIVGYDTLQDYEAAEIKFWYRDTTKPEGDPEEWKPMTPHVYQRGVFSEETSRLFFVTGGTYGQYFGPPTSGSNPEILGFDWNLRAWDRPGTWPNEASYTRSDTATRCAGGRIYYLVGGAVWSFDPPSNKALLVTKVASLERYGALACDSRRNRLVLLATFAYTYQGAYLQLDDGGSLAKDGLVRFNFAKGDAQKEISIGAPPSDSGIKKGISIGGEYDPQLDSIVLVARYESGGVIGTPGARMIRVPAESLGPETAEAWFWDDLTGPAPTTHKTVTIGTLRYVPELSGFVHMGSSITQNLHFLRTY